MKIEIEIPYMVCDNGNAMQQSIFWFDDDNFWSVSVPSAKCSTAMSK